MKAYLHFGGPFTDEQPAPRLTVEVPVKNDPLQWQKRGLHFNASGYGAKIPTTYKIQWEGRWRRVYCAVYGNAGTAYIESGRKPVATVDIYNEWGGHAI